MTWMLNGPNHEGQCVFTDGAFVFVCFFFYYEFQLNVSLNHMIDMFYGYIVYSMNIVLMISEDVKNISVGNEPIAP